MLCHWTEGLEMITFVLCCFVACRNHVPSSILALGAEKRNAGIRDVTNQIERDI